ncbi:MAG: nucleotide pyrophosphatase/phosphodiesterase family protein [Candidatus Eremiobacterota bacterium]
MRTAVLDVVALTPSLLERMPRLRRWGHALPIEQVFPALTCPAQATYLTGLPPSGHGAVANGWYFREECEVRFWRQSNRLVAGPKLWERLREARPGFTCAKLFWWFNMYSSADWSVTPRPMYPADGRKIPDLYTRPAGLRDELQRRLGRFPLFEFWGPRASLRSTRWIAECARHVEDRYRPDLSLVYLPHLDYPLQRLGPDHPLDLGALDQVLGDLIDFYAGRGVEVTVLSEYAMNRVTRPVFLNRALRRRGWLEVREELGRELLDPGASRAFAVVDHQVAHVYVNDPHVLGSVRAELESLAGVERVLQGGGHPRAGELMAVAEPDAWFPYYYWLDDRRAPDFARTVDIHRKPGYDPVELFFDPDKPWPLVRAAGILALRSLGFRSLMSLTPLRPELVRGSHGRPAPEQPLLLTRRPEFFGPDPLPATRVCEALMRLYATLTP